MEDGNTLGYAIAAVVIATAIGNMFVSKKMKGLSRIRFFADTSSKDPFHFSPFAKRKVGNSGTANSQRTPETETIVSPRINANFLHEINSRVLVDHIPFPVDDILTQLKIPSTYPYAPLSKDVKAAYRAFALINHPDTVDGSDRSISSDLFRDVTLEYKKLLSTLEELEKSKNIGK